eukprot:GILJ01012589.1.p1 GENE.GILJ01012589.1~~GILJ01012589.1.p1  ORF type:complete len:2248 (+),score=499.29 GILJ01012589.1:691-6744(+)
MNAKDSELHAQIQKLNQQLQQRDSLLERAKQENDKLNQELQKARSSLHHALARSEESSDGGSNEEVRVLMKRIHEQGKRVSELEGELHGSDQEQSRMKEEIEKLKQLNDELKGKRVMLRQTKSPNTTVVEDSPVSSKERDRGDSMAQIITQAKSIEQLLQQKYAIEQDRLRLQGELDRFSQNAVLREVYDTVVKEKEETEKELEDFRDKVIVMSKERQDLNQAVEELDQICAELEKDKAKLQSEHEQASQIIQEMEQILKTRESELIRLSEEKESITEHFAQVNAELTQTVESLQNQLLEKEAEREQKESESEKWQQQLAGLEQLYAEKSAELDQLRITLEQQRTASEERAKLLDQLRADSTSASEAQAEKIKNLEAIRAEHMAEIESLRGQLNTQLKSQITETDAASRLVECESKLKLLMDEERKLRNEEKALRQSLQETKEQLEVERRVHAELKWTVEQKDMELQTARQLERSDSVRRIEVQETVSKMRQEKDESRRMIDHLTNKLTADTLHASSASTEEAVQRLTTVIEHKTLEITELKNCLSELGISKTSGSSLSDSVSQFKTKLVRQDSSLSVQLQEKESVVAELSSKVRSLESQLQQANQQRVDMASFASELNLLAMERKTFQAIAALVHGHVKSSMTRRKNVSLYQHIITAITPSVHLHLIPDPLPTNDEPAHGLDSELMRSALPLELLLSEHSSLLMCVEQLVTVLTDSSDPSRTDLLGMSPASRSSSSGLRVFADLAPFDINCQQHIPDTPLVQHLKRSLSVKSVDALRKENNDLIRQLNMREEEIMTLRSLAAKGTESPEQIGGSPKSARLTADSSRFDAASPLSVSTNTSSPSVPPMQSLQSRPVSTLNMSGVPPTPSPVNLQAPMQTGSGLWETLFTGSDAMRAGSLGASLNIASGQDRATEFSSISSKLEEQQALLIRLENRIVELSQNKDSTQDFASLQLEIKSCRELIQKLSSENNRVSAELKSRQEADQSLLNQHRSEMEQREALIFALKTEIEMLKRPHVSETGDRDLKQMMSALFKLGQRLEDLMIKELDNKPAIPGHLNALQEEIHTFKTLFETVTLGKMQEQKVEEPIRGSTQAEEEAMRLELTQCKDFYRALYSQYDTLNQNYAQAFHSLEASQAEIESLKTQLNSAQETAAALQDQLALVQSEKALLAEQKQDLSEYVSKLAALQAQTTLSMHSHSYHEDHGSVQYEQDDMLPSRSPQRRDRFSVHVSRNTSPRSLVLSPKRKSKSVVAGSPMHSVSMTYSPSYHDVIHDLSSDAIHEMIQNYEYERKSLLHQLESIHIRLEDERRQWNRERDILLRNSELGTSSEQIRSFEDQTYRLTTELKRLQDDKERLEDLARAGVQELDHLRAALSSANEQLGKSHQDNSLLLQHSEQLEKERAAALAELHSLETDRSRMESRMREILVDVGVHLQHKAEWDKEKIDYHKFVDAMHSALQQLQKALETHQRQELLLSQENAELIRLTNLKTQEVEELNRDLQQSVKDKLSSMDRERQVMDERDQLRAELSQVMDSASESQKRHRLEGHSLQQRAEAKQADLSSEVESLQVSLSQVDKALASTKQDFAAEKQKRIQAESMVSELTQRVTELKNELLRVERERDLAQSDLNSLRQRLLHDGGRTETEISQLRQQLFDKELLVSKLQTQYADLQRESNQVKETVSTMIQEFDTQTKLKLEKKDLAMAALRADYDAVLRKQTESTAELDHALLHKRKADQLATENSHLVSQLNQVRADLDQERASKERDIQNLSSKLNRIESELVVRLEELSAIKADRDRLRHTESDIDSARRASQQKLDTLTRTHRELEMQLANRTSELDQLRVENQQVLDRLQHMETKQSQLESAKSNQDELVASLQNRLSTQEEELTKLRVKLDAYRRRYTLQHQPEYQQAKRQQQEQQQYQTEELTYMPQGPEHSVPAFDVDSNHAVSGYQAHASSLFFAGQQQPIPEVYSRLDVESLRATALDDIQMQRNEGRLPDPNLVRYANQLEDALNQMYSSHQL